MFLIMLARMVISECKNVHLEVWHLDVAHTANICSRVTGSKPKSFQQTSFPVVRGWVGIATEIPTRPDRT